MCKELSKEELVELVNKICKPKLSDEAVSEYIEILEGNVPHPAPSDLIFWNEERSCEKLAFSNYGHNEIKAVLNENAENVF